MEDTTNASPSESRAHDEFGITHVVQPLSAHTFTAILLHGRGSTGQEFAQDLFESRLSDGKTLQDSFPGFRWVFPSSKVLWSTTFQDNMPAWFEAHSLTDITARQDLQVEGITDSVRHVCDMLDKEIRLLNDKPEKLVLGGISQGGAIALWTLLCQKRRDSERLGAVIGTNTWLPFLPNIRRVLGQQSSSSGVTENKIGRTSNDFDGFVVKMTAPCQRESHRDRETSAFMQTPVFMGHGTDDAYVDVELGREAADVLSSIGLNVQWHDYAGAEEEGHWLKIPEELDDISGFLNNCLH